jgi:hypothetical protein
MPAVACQWCPNQERAVHRRSVIGARTPAFEPSTAGTRAVGDGIFLMYDTAAPSGLDQQVGSAWAPLLYGMNVFGCPGDSLAADGAGLGNMWGRQRPEKMLRQAGFSQVSVHDEADPINAIYVCRA